MINNKPFEICSEFQPAGDQPRAIRELVGGLNSGEKDQVLLGVTGSGKTFTMAQVIQEVQRPTLIISHNKTLAAQLYQEFKGFFLTMLWAILFLITTITSPKPIYHPPTHLSKRTHLSMMKLTG